MFTNSRWKLVATAIAAVGITALAGCASNSNAAGGSTPPSSSTSSAAPTSAQSPTSEAGTTGAATSGSAAPASSEATSGSASPSGSASAPGASVDAASLVPADIKAKGTLTVATDATYAPNEFVKPGSNDIVGLDPDLAVALGQQLGLKLNMVNASFDTIIPGLQSGKYDMGLSAYTDTKEREKVVDFVVYYQTGESFFIKADSTKTYAGLDSLCGAKVSVETGTTEEADANTQSDACTKAGKSKVDVLSFADQNAANLAVSSGRADLGFADTQVVGYMLTQSNGQFKETGDPVNVTPSGIALPKGNGMAAAVQAALQNLIADGTYDKIFKQWGMDTNEIGASDIKINAAIS